MLVKRSKHMLFLFSSRRRHTRSLCDWSSDVCSSDLLVHLAQDATFFTPLPPSASVVGEAQVVSLRDRGEGRGALLTLERNIRDRASGAPYCRLHQTLLLRGDGGFDGPAAPADASGIPDAEPDARCSFQTSRRAALIYRLSGDWNPLHLRPEFAQKAGFERPILQGLASYGIAGAAVSRALEQDAVAVTRLACRFSGVVMPGDKLDFHIWRLGGRTAAFRAFVDTRKVLDFGHISWEPLV